MIKRSLKAIENGVSAELLKGCVSEHKKTIDRFQKLDDLYKGNHNILKRTQIGTDAPNNKIVANFPKYITDTSIGYMFGFPIEYQSEQTLDDLKKAFERVDIDTHDAELGKDLSVFGTAFEFVYMSADETPIPKIAILDPRETFVVYDDTIGENPLFGVYYCEQYDLKGDVSGYLIHCFTKLTSSIYTAKEIGDVPVFVEKIPHYFGEIPLLQFWNNEEGMGDFEHVESLINAYNVLQSDRVNDKERFVSAILVVENAVFDEESGGKDMLKEGILNIPGENSKVYYLTKTLNENETETLKKSLSDDIHKFSQTPDFTDEKFSGNTSGVAMKYKIQSLEHLAKIKQQFFIAGLRERLKLFANILSVQGKMLIIADEIKIIFNRTLPANDFETAQMVAAYAASGTVSKETLLTQISFVKDPAEELNRIKAEQTAKQQELDTTFGGNSNVDEIRL